MQIFLEQKMIFFSNPKSGSSSYTEVLTGVAGIPPNNMPPFKHMNVKTFEKNVAPVLRQITLEKLDRIAVLRPPLQRMESWYRYRRRLPATDAKSTANVSFEIFIKEYLKPDCAEYASIGNQLNFVTRSQKKIGIQHLFSTENSKPLMEFLENRFGILPPIPRKNVSSPADTTLSAETRREFGIRRSGEIELYNRVMEANGHLETVLD